MINITFTLEDAVLEADIEQAQIDAKVSGLPMDQFLENAARSGFEQFRGARKRNVLAIAQKFVELVNASDPAQTALLTDVLNDLLAKLETVQGGKP